MSAHITRIHAPEGVLEAPGYSNVVSGSGRTVYVSGQIARDVDGNLVGRGDFVAQAEQVFANIELCLTAAGATFDDVVKVTYFLTDMRNIPLLRDVLWHWTTPEKRWASSAVQVSALFEPGYLLEIEAVAIVATPEAGPTS
ncbi:RidA family protein [Luteipulveratus sp. YIM 133132]|uniref:RidA family protein n=1 Tax=Luteipulveratus flavus TaxID=3031728 RepID=A0ABT6C5G0_9MICO|nr:MULTISPECIES: RidA family protein [unclassified Luteipulveratus]MDE9364064.1 RidA family protein [Luteipulveratus sp. YIM 133132]MDF8263567.1 RidA family protein [Luteipulveratus sp. YIM 133296]